MNALTWNDGLNLNCPVCGDIHTHIDDIEAIVRRQEDAPATSISVNRTGVVAVDSLGDGYPRRHTFILHGMCEAGCRWSVSFRQHKGSTEVYVHNKGQTELIDL